MHTTPDGGAAHWTLGQKGKRFELKFSQLYGPYVIFLDVTPRCNNASFCSNTCPFCFFPSYLNFKQTSAFRTR